MQKRTQFSLLYYLLVIGLILALDWAFFSRVQVPEISYSEFRHRVAANRVKSVVITSGNIYGVMKEESSTSPTPEGKKETNPLPPPKATPWRVRLHQLEQEREEEAQQRFTVVPVQDEGLVPLLNAHGVDYRQGQESNWLSNLLLNWILPFAVLFLLWGFIMRRLGRGPTSLNLGRNKAKIYEQEPAQRVTFQDVAGIEEAVEEVREIVGFLKDPASYTRLGAKLPKGVLLVGPPGTGKTLLARATAGEAKVPFFSLTGSDFVEMFVGVGAARVRDLFREANKAAPCIIFIDELDAVGKARGAVAGSYGGYDERENTLNQLLAEMDGFDASLGIVMMGATNRPEVLDPALLRPGRFDRQILVDRPDRKGRAQILALHSNGLVLDEDVDLDRLAAMTPGFVGADLANICNEAALLANRKRHQKIQMADFEDAIERVVAGLERKSRLINERERQIVAYHESGHAIVGHFTPGADPVQKVSIVPRGLKALGYTLQSPLEDRYLMSRSEILGRIKGLLGGRAAEEVIFGEISTGGADDLEKASRIIREMLTVYGMSKRLPNLSLVAGRRAQFLQEEPSEGSSSEKFEQMLDEERMEILNECYESDKQLLGEKRHQLDELAHLLQADETIDAHDIERVLGPRPKAPTTDSH